MKKMIALVVMVFMLCPGLSLAAGGEPNGGSVDTATTVKSGKSNADNRVKGGSAKAATSVKSGKSNSSDRGKGGNADAATTVKSSKSNSSE